MKYLLDVTLLANSRPMTLPMDPMSSLLRIMEEKTVLCPSLLPITPILTMEPPPGPVTEQGLSLHHLMSLLQLPYEVGSMVTSLSQGRMLTGSNLPSNSVVEPGSGPGLHHLSRPGPCWALHKAAHVQMWP